MTPAEVVVSIFGGVSATARVAGVRPSTVCRWLQPRQRGGTGGRVPKWHHELLIEAAKARGRPLSEQTLTIGIPTMTRRIIRIL